MRNFDVHWQHQKSSNVLQHISTQSRGYFSSNLHQVIWIQFDFLDTKIL